MRAEYDANADALYAYLTDADVARTVEIDDSTNVDLDASGGIVGIEVLAPGHLWPLAEIIRRWDIAPADAAMLMAYCPFRCSVQVA